MKKTLLLFLMIIGLQSCTESTNDDNYGTTIFKAFQSNNFDTIELLPLENFLEIGKELNPNFVTEQIEVIKKDYAEAFQKNKEYVKQVYQEGEQQGIIWKDIVLVNIEKDDTPYIDLNKKMKAYSCNFMITFSYKEKQFVIEVLNVLRFDTQWYLGGVSAGGLSLKEVKNQKVTPGKMNKTSTYQGYVNSENGLNIRSSPNLGSDKIVTIPYNGTVTVLNRINISEEMDLGNGRIANGEWVYVSYQSSKTNQEFKGYIFDYFINFSFDSKANGKTLDEIREAFYQNKSYVMDKVSTNFLYSMEALAFDEETERPKRVRIEIQGITDKNTTFQRIDYYPGVWYAYNEIPCNPTNYFEISETNTPMGIGSRGYFIIWDYNMDGLEDFAVLHDVGGSAGSWYDYFLQQEDGTFIRDESFPLQGMLFPTSIDIENKTITQVHPVGCCTISTEEYKKIAKGKWELIVSKTEDL